MGIKENKGGDFQQGFNEGYLLAKHNFKLADKIADALKGTERGSGFKQGCIEFSKEKIKLPNWLKEFSSRSINTEKAKDADRNSIDKE